MYRHIAESIKETENKRFLSRADIDKYENQYPEMFIKRENVYNKEEFDKVMGELKTTFINIDGEVPSIENTKQGVIQNLVIKGNTEQPTETIEVVPELEVGTISQSTGENAEVTDRMRTKDFIPVKPGDVIKPSNDIGNQANYINLVHYNSNKEFISIGGFNSSFEIPENCAYIRYFHRTDYTISKISIERTHLDIINSVGTDLGDGTYELKVLIRGTNLFNKNSDEIVRGYKISYPDGGLEVDTLYNVSHYIPVSGNVVLGNRNAKVVAFYDINKNFIHKESISIGRVFNTNTIKGCKYMRFNYEATLEDSIQVEFGEKLSEYRPYEERIESIIIPCQLEGINVYRDSLFKREDGVWCIEKKIKTFLINGSSNELYGGGERDTWKQYCNDEYFSFLVDFERSFGLPKYPEKIFALYDNLISTVSGVCISNRFKFNVNMLSSTLKAERIQPRNAAPNYLGFRIKKNRIPDYDNVMIDCTYDVFKANIQNFFKENPTIVKIPMADAEIIELPLESQLVLNTFEGCTNICFEGDVQPHVSGLAPKTLSAEVNSIQSQLDDISDRIIKLDSLQEGNSINYSSYVGDIYVDRSNNGVANDINIKGKTLVNVLGRGFKDHAKDAYVKLAGELVDDGYVKFSTDNNTSDLQAYRKLSETLLKTSTQYTLIVDILECTITGADDYHILYPVSNPDNEYINDCAFNETWGLFARECIPGSRHAKLITTKSSFDNILYGMRSYVRYIEGMTGHVTYRLMLLEGDFTENPPTYFEGVKSAGELSDVISIESRNESKNLFDINNFDIMCYSWDIPYKVNKMNTPIKIVDNSVEISMPSYLSAWNIGVGGYYKIKKDTDYKLSFGFGYCHSGYNLCIHVLGIYEHELYKNISTSTTYMNYYPRLKRVEVISGNGGSLVYNTKDYDYLFVYIGGLWKKSPTESRTIMMSDIAITEVSDNIDLSHEFMSKKLIARSESGEYFEIDSLKSTESVSDTIEKHSDGKYYYHKRCGQVTVDGTNPEQYAEYTSQTLDETIVVYSPPIDDTLDEATKFMSDSILNTGKTYWHVPDVSKWNMDEETINTDIHGGLRLFIRIKKSRLSTPDVSGVVEWVQSNPITIVGRLHTEEVYEIVNLNVNLYDGETNVYVRALPFSPELSLNANQYIGDVIDDLQSRAKVLENTVIDQILSQNKLLLSSIYSADKTNLKVDIVSLSTYNVSETDYKIYKLLDRVISYGKYYSVTEMEEIIDFYTMVGKIDFEMAEILLSKLSKE